MTQRYYFQQELQHKPISSQVYHIRHTLVLHQYQVLCIYEGENEGGFYEVWKAKYTQGYIKQDISYSSYITKPFEYDEESLGFFDSRNGNLYQMYYLREGLLNQIHIPLPTHLFKETLQIEMDECLQEKYLINCIDIQSHFKKLIVMENLGVFETPTGDVCDDSIITTWSADGQMLGEAIIKKAREPLHFHPLDHQHVIIYRQNFFSELLQFHIWDCCTSAELSMPITLQLELNACIVNAFPWKQDVFENKSESLKQEHKQLMQVIIFANSNSDRHPIAIIINLNNVRDVYSFRMQKIILDQKSSMFIQGINIIITMIISPMEQSIYR